MKSRTRTSPEQHFEARHRRTRRRWLAVTGVAVSLFTAITVVPDHPWSLRGSQALPVGHDLLMSALDDLRRALLPAERERAVAVARGNVESLRAPLLWVLGQQRHPRFAEVIAFAGLVGCVAAEERLTELANDAASPRRNVAIVALDRLRPWGEDELADLLRADDAPVVAAAMTVVASRPEVVSRVLEPILAVVGGTDSGLRTAALALLPTTLPRACMPMILDIQANDRALGLQLLGRLEVTPETSQAFADAAVAADRDDGAAAALDRVPARTLDEPTRTRLWAVATGLGADEVRASALAMLERFADKTPLPADVGTWSPELRYRAARVGLAGGDPQAPGLMVELAFDSDPKVAAIAGQARMAASRAARLPPHAPRQRWDEWLAARAVPATPAAAGQLAAPPR